MPSPIRLTPQPWGAGSPERRTHQPLRVEIGPEIAQHFFGVEPGFRIGNALHPEFGIGLQFGRSPRPGGTGAGVVAGDRQPGVAVPLPQQPGQVAAAEACIELRLLEVVAVRVRPATSSAVAGISCISPTAPTGEATAGEKRDSCLAIARASSLRMPAASLASAKLASYRRGCWLRCRSSRVGQSSSTSRRLARQSRSRPFQLSPRASRSWPSTSPSAGEGAVPWPLPRPLASVSGCRLRQVSQAALVNPSRHRVSTSASPLFRGSQPDDLGWGAVLASVEGCSSDGSGVPWRRLTARQV